MAGSDCSSSIFDRSSPSASRTYVRRAATPHQQTNTAPPAPACISGRENDAVGSRESRSLLAKAGPLPRATAGKPVEISSLLSLVPDHRTRYAPHSRIDVAPSVGSSRLRLHLLLGQASRPSIVDSAATAHQRHRPDSIWQLPETQRNNRAFCCVVAQVGAPLDR